MSELPLRQAPSAPTDRRGSVPDGVSHDDIIRSFYRVFLKREADEEGLRHHVRRLVSDGIDLVISDFIASPESKGHQTSPDPAFVKFNFMAPMAVQTTTTSRQLDDLWDHIGAVWSAFGDTDPLWSVLTYDRFRSEGGLDGESYNAFYASGANDVRYLNAFLARAGLREARFAVVAEYGCGVGRTTAALARRYGSIRAFDISLAHLKLAEAHFAKEHITNVELVHVSGRENLDRLNGVDLFFSIIVLQHNPPPIILDILGRAFAGLNPGGVAFFQVPVFSTDYSFNIEQYWAHEAAQKTMELHFVAQKDIMDLAEAHGMRLLETRQDHCLGRYHDMLSHTYLMQKRG